MQIIFKLIYFYYLLSTPYHRLLLLHPQRQLLPPQLPTTTPSVAYYHRQLHFCLLLIYPVAQYTSLTTTLHHHQLLLPYTKPTTTFQRHADGVASILFKTAEEADKCVEAMDNRLRYVMLHNTPTAFDFSAVFGLWLSCVCIYNVISRLIYVCDGVVV